MRLLLILTCSFLLSATSEFNVKGMMCGVGCVNKIKSNVGSLDGVKNCDVNFDKGLLMVEYDEAKINDQTILKTLQDKTTYSCSLKKDEPKKGFFKRIFGWF
tara:strand:+ start:444 stop:749 length:306 start_codon:yes stop_codon:yes gene_type:complete